MSGAHPKCVDGHVCQEPSGRECIERLNRISAQLDNIAASFGVRP